MYKTYFDDSCYTKNFGLLRDKAKKMGLEGGDKWYNKDISLRNPFYFKKEKEVVPPAVLDKVGSSTSVSSPVSNTTSNKPTISNTGTNTKSVTAKDKEGWLKKAKDAIGKDWDNYKGALTGKKGRLAQASAIVSTVAAAAGTAATGLAIHKAIKNRNKKQDEDEEQLNEQQELRAAFSRPGEQNEFSSLERLLGDSYIEN